MSTTHSDIFAKRWYPTLHVPKSNIGVQTDNACADVSPNTMNMLASSISDLTVSLPSVLATAVADASVLAVTQMEERKFKRTYSRPSTTDIEWAFSMSLWNLPMDPAAKMSLNSMLLGPVSTVISKVATATPQKRFKGMLPPSCLVDSPPSPALRGEVDWFWAAYTASTGPPGAKSVGLDDLLQSLKAQKIEKRYVEAFNRAKELKFGRK